LQVIPLQIISRSCKDLWKWVCVDKLGPFLNDVLIN